MHVHLFIPLYKERYWLTQSLGKRYFEESSKYSLDDEFKSTYEEFKGIKPVRKSKEEP